MSPTASPEPGPTEPGPTEPGPTDRPTATDPPAASPAPTVPTVPSPDGDGTALLLVLSAVLGVVATIAGYAFVVLVHEAERAVWVVVPGWWGAAEAPPWWVVSVLVAGAVAVYGASRLPGHGGHHPLDGLAFDIGPRSVASALLAAFATLVAGAVVGPEAPLLAIGSALALAVAARRPRGGLAQPLVLATAAAALGLVFGNPLLTGILVLEVLVLAGERATRRTLVMHRLLPVLAALGSGYVMRVGIGEWTGLPAPTLAIDGLVAYPSVLVTDLLVGVVVALAITGLALAATAVARRLRTRAARTPLRTLVAAALGIAGLALTTQALTGEPVSMVLFSGQSDIAAVVQLGSVATLLVITVAKGAAYALSVGSGFRGGAIFPVVFLGAAIAAAVHALAPGTSLAGLVAVGVAAAAATVSGLPFTSVLLAVLTVLPAGLAVTVPAVLGVVVSLVVTTALTDRRDRRAAAQSFVTGE